jgi:hypothetical protein
MDRMVALKVTTEPSGEARALAALEHDHIVRVFGTAVDRATGFHLLSMQYVPGPTLATVLAGLGHQEKPDWSGRDLLHVLAGCVAGAIQPDPSGPQDGERIGRWDQVEVVCWLGARLADALDHAHRHGILHRDVKPSNILLHANGRVLLTDFNLSCDPREGLQPVGGTLAYMAPEHLDALEWGDPATAEAVDSRSDVYSLGVVLFEVLTGRRPFTSTPRGDAGEVLRALAEERRREPPSPRRLLPHVPPALDGIVRRCLDPDPSRRYQQAGELAAALDGCRELQRWEHTFPAPLGATRLAQAAPILAFIVLAVAPHLIGSAVNIAYNTSAIVNDLNPKQQGTFQFVLLAYNAAVYPLCTWLLCRVMLPVVRTLRQLAGGERHEAAAVARQRRRALAAPMLTVALSCLGWFPGGILFPLLIHVAAGPLAAEVFVQFIVSFTISGLIATTYSYFGMQLFVIRILYPRLWVDPLQPQQQTRFELGSMEHRLRLFQFAAGLIPLSGAMLLMTARSEGPMTFPFRVLVVGLICLGMAGFGVALFAGCWAGRILAAMLGDRR